MENNTAIPVLPLEQLKEKNNPSAPFNSPDFQKEKQAKDPSMDGAHARPNVFLPKIALRRNSNPASGQDIKDTQILTSLQNDDLVMVVGDILDVLNIKYHEREGSLGLDVSIDTHCINCIEKKEGEMIIHLELCVPGYHA